MFGLKIEYSKRSRVTPFISRVILELMNVAVFKDTCLHSSRYEPKNSFELATVPVVIVIFLYFAVLSVTNDAYPL